MIVNKVTVGFVIQQFDTDTNEWVGQDFCAGDDVSYEDNETGEPVSDEIAGKVSNYYFEFNMVQPSQAFPDGQV